MSLNAKSDLSLLPLLPTNESPQEPSLAANGLTSVLSEHKIAKIRAKHDSRGCGRALTNGKHEQFASLIALGQNPASAYSSCGYSSKGAGQSANRLLQKPEVSARVKELKVAVSERQVEKTLVNRAWLMQTLRQIVDRAMQFEPERDRHGNPSGQYKYDPATAIKAVELMGRELGVFQKKDESSGAVPLAEAKARLSEARDRLAAAKKKALEQGFDWPPPSKAAIAAAKKQLELEQQQEGEG